MFGTYFRIYSWKKQYFIIGIILPVAMIFSIYRIERHHTMPTFGKKPDCRHMI